jgi:hypothetical protein
MYQAASPTLATRRRTGLAELPLGLVSVVSRDFTVPRSRVDGTAIADYFSDLADGFGVPYTGGASWHAEGNAYPDMVPELLDQLGPEPFDVVVLAAAVPDLDPWRSAATRLNDVLPGSPLLFAVSDQGSGATFTALRLAGEYAARHDYRRALVLGMDQATLPYDTGESVLGGDAAVALVLERGSGTVSVGQVSDVEPGEVPDVLGELLAGVTPATIVAGCGVGMLPGFDALKRVAAGFPCTGLWTAPRGRTAYLDYDPAHGDLSLCLAG